MEAINQNVEAFYYASEALKDDKKFVLEVVKKYGYALNYVSRELIFDKDVLKAAVRPNWESLTIFNEMRVGDKDVVLLGGYNNVVILYDVGKDIKKYVESLLENKK